MKKLLYGLVILWSTLPLSTQTNDYCGVFVHIGNDIPPHTLTAIQQFRLFNPSCPLYLIAQHKSIKKLHKQLDYYHVEGVSTESLPRTQAHSTFLHTTRLDSHWANGFWKYTTERFFYLEELAITKNLSKIFHLENDVMVYRDLAELVPTLQKHYKGIAMTFGWDHVAVAGFMYIPSLQALQKVTNYIASHAWEGKDDGIILAQLKDEKGPQYIDYLPHIFREYTQKYELINAGGTKARDARRFYQFSDEFPGIFDAGAIGQYLGGISPLNGSLPAGYVNTHCIFDVRRLKFIWKYDERGRNIPYALFGNVAYRINNLHVHSKNLKVFCS